MTIKSKKSLGSNCILKISALIFGYAFWLILAQDQTIEITPMIPLSFYMPENNFKIVAPSELTAKLSGKRLNLQKLNLNNIGAHIDASNLNQPGTYRIEINPEHIFLPSYVKLLYYHPVIVNLELIDE
jgi:YbbR domain-containing protein